MMKKYLISFISVLTALLIFCSIKTGIDFWHVFGLLKQSTSKADRVLCSVYMAKMASAFVLTLACANVLLMLLQKGTIREITSKVYKFRTQIVLLCVMVFECIYLLFFVEGNPDLTVEISISAFLFGAIMLGINTVGFFRDKKKSEADREM